jgi:gliding motility-associated-like protein
VTGGIPPYQYSINNNGYQDANTFNNLSAGFYEVSIIDDNDCTYETSINIALQAGPDINTDPFINVIQGESITLDVLVDIPFNEIDSIYWTPANSLTCSDCLNPTIVEATFDETYTVTIIDIFGCESFATIRVDVELDIDISVPNIINTNSNNGNNKFTIYTNESVELIDKMQIYDRWGNLVYINENFEPNNPDIGWDGRFQGQDVVQGVFVYLIKFRTIEGEEQVLTGDLTVIR